MTPLVQSRREELEARIREFHGVERAEILEAIEYLRDPGDTVIAAGSLAFGLGNRLSDLDLVIAGVGSFHSTRVPIENFVGSLRVDIWKLDQSVIDEVFARADAAVGGDAAMGGRFGDVDHEDDLKLLHRIAFGVVWDGDPLVPSTVDDYRDVAVALVAREYTERAREALFLAHTGVLAERWCSSTVNTRAAVEAALQARIVADGAPFTGDKWLHDRLQADAASLSPVYAPFMVLPDGPEDAKPFLDAATATCAELFGVDVSFAATNATAWWRASDIEVHVVGDRNLLLSSTHAAVWDLDAAEAATWARLRERAERASESAMHWAARDLEDSEQAFLFRLHEAGLAQLDWTEGVISNGGPR